MVLLLLKVRMVKLLSLCIDQKKEQPWVHLPPGSEHRGCDTGGTPPRLSCSGRKLLRRPSRVRPRVDKSRCSSQLQGKARLPLMRMLGVNRMVYMFGILIL